MAGSEGGKSQNYWPGFVDALSNMVMVMVFIVLVLMVAIVYFSTQVIGKAAEISREAQQNSPVSCQQFCSPEEARQEVARLRRDLDAAQAQNKALQGNHPSASAAIVAGQSQTQSTLPGSASIANSGATAPKAAPGNLPTTVAGDRGVVSMTFAASETALGREAQARLDTELKPDKLQHYDILAEIGDADGYTNGQRQAYFRGLAVRNYLLTHGVSPANIQLRLVGKAGSLPPRVLIRPWKP